MFCTNCGKEIIDTAKFCNFCGMPVKNMAASVPVTPIDPVQSIQPVQAARPEQLEQPVPQPEQTAPDYTESTSIPVTENAPETPEGIPEIPPVDSAPEYESDSAIAEETAEPAVEASADGSAVPTPNDIPTYGASTPVYSAPPAYPNTPANTVHITQEIKAEVAPESKPERKYTLGHIMMCLAAVAVMAIVAGVFAGLYFSVV